jgi:hypothetical protein
MTIDFSQRLGTITGAPLTDQGKDVPLTLAAVSVAALLADYNNEQPTADEKVRRWKLAQKIHGASEITLAIDDVVLIKKLIGIAYAPLVVGQAFEMLEKST